MSEADSFIEEVNEELRRDKLFTMMRKYGWIPVTFVILAVGGAAYNEYRLAQTEAAAQAFGDAVLSALEKSTPEDRSLALTAVQPADEDGQVFLDILRAATRAEASDRPGALELLDSVAGNAEAPETYRELAMFKAVVLRGSDQDRNDRLAILEQLSAPGRPFRVLALEQKALALYEFGDNDGAIEILRTILEDAAVTQGLLQRAQQLIVAMGEVCRTTLRRSAPTGKRKLPDVLGQ